MEISREGRNGFAGQGDSETRIRGFHTKDIP